MENAKTNGCYRTSNLHVAAWLLSNGLQACIQKGRQIRVRLRKGLAVLSEDAPRSQQRSDGQQPGHKLSQKSGQKSGQIVKY